MEGNSKHILDREGKRWRPESSPIFSYAKDGCHPKKLPSILGWNLKPWPLNPHHFKTQDPKNWWVPFSSAYSMILWYDSTELCPLPQLQAPWVTFWFCPFHFTIHASGCYYLLFGFQNWVSFTILQPQPTLTLPFLLKTSSAGCYFACSLHLALGPTRNLRPPEAQAVQFVSTLLLGGDLPWFSSCCLLGAATWFKSGTVA